MQKLNHLDDPQNPLGRRLFLISPQPSFFKRLEIAQDHPAAEVVAITSPRLRYETWFEGRRQAWRTKAKRDFLEYFRDLWSSPYAPASVAPDFLQELSIDVPVDSLFDQWWTIRDHFDLLEMDETWRPS